MRRDSTRFYVLVATLLMILGGQSFATDVQVEMSELMDSVGSLTIKVIDESSSSPLSQTTESTFHVSSGESYYKKIRLSVDGLVGEVGCSGTVCAYIPAGVTQSTVVACLSSATGTAKEIREMWYNDAYINPQSEDEAALYYARTLASAEKCISAKMSNQYELIATYLALRAFQSYARESTTPLAMSSELKRIGIRYKDLLAKLNFENLSAISREKLTVYDTLFELEVFYTKEWRRIKTLAESNPHLAFQQCVEYGESLYSEPEASGILARIKIANDEPIASALKFAGSAVQNNNGTDSDFGGILDKLERRLKALDIDFVTIQRKKELEQELIDLRSKL